jgi:hypothetical protein
MPQPTLNSEPSSVSSPSPPNHHLGNAMPYFIVMGVVISLLRLLMAWTLFGAAGKEPPDNPNRPP